jgi:MoaA/NifB/PqqE/SkfB family radical SAM enzyme
MLRSFKIKYFWIYVTEKCNLKCRYCFYKYRNGVKNLDFKNIKILFNFFPQVKDAEFVISGGEPLIEWGLTCKIIDYLRSRSNKYILVQTNGLLLDKQKIKVIKNANIGIELGLDGKLPSMSKYRMGIRRYFNKLLDNIAVARSNNLKLYATMTVHPAQAQQILMNYQYLINIGIDKVEITPAAFERWNKKDSSTFNKEYREVVKFAVSNKKLSTISTEYDKPLEKMTIDLVPLPDNNVMTNWALLSLPRNLKMKFALCHINDNNISFNNSFLKLFLKKYQEFYSRNSTLTYRDYSDLNVAWVYKELYGDNESKRFKNYVMIGNILKNINQKIPRIN